MFERRKKDMQLPDFKLERYFAKYEFNAPYLLCCSDCQSFSLKEILSLEPQETKDRFENLWLGYTEAQGSKTLRERIAGLYQNINSEEVLVHAGAEEAIFNFMNVFFNPGDHVIVQFPCYQSLIEIVQGIGCQVTKWELKQEKNNWTIDMDFLKNSIRKNTKAIIINTPHNPTGFTFTKTDLETIIGLAQEHNITLFCDEVYKYLEYDSKNRTPWICDLDQKAVSLGVMSKSFGLPGLRIGWIATKNKEVYRKMASFKDYTSICNSAPSEFLAEIALKHKEKILKRNLGIIQENLSLLEEFLQKMNIYLIGSVPKEDPLH